MSEKVDLKKVLEGLDTELRKSRDGEIYVYLNSAFEPELCCGMSHLDVRVLTPEASKTLLERLDAELRVPEKGEVAWGNNGWYTTEISHSNLRICEKKPEPELRRLEPGEPAMPGDRLLGAEGKDIGEACNTYKHSFPNFQDSSQAKYARKPWTSKEYQERQEEWVKFHNLKPGDAVKVCCNAETSQDGWPEYWCDDMDEAVGTEFKVNDIQIGGIQSEGDGYLYPFYVLQVIKKPVVTPGNTGLGYKVFVYDPNAPTTKYREFRTPQEVLAWVQEHGQIVVKKNGDWKTIYAVSKTLRGVDMLTHGVNVADHWTVWTSAKDGTPFGVPE